MKIEDVIAAACEELQISYSENALWFKVLVNQVMRTFRSSHATHVYDILLTAEDSRITLPDGYNKLLTVHLCNGGLYCEKYDFDIQNDCIIFKSQLGIIDGYKFNIKYRGFPVDEHGDLILKPEWERMFVAYIGWKYSRRHFERYAPVMDSFKREYQLQRVANV